GIAFGYELVDLDWEIDYPDLDRPSNWGDDVPVTPPPPPIASRSMPERRRRAAQSESADPVDAFVWPPRSPMGAGGWGLGEGRGGDLDSFHPPGSDGLAGGNGLSAYPGSSGAGGDVPPSHPGRVPIAGFGGGPGYPRGMVRSFNDDDIDNGPLPGNSAGNGGWPGTPRPGSSGNPGTPGPSGLVTVPPGGLPGFEDPSGPQGSGPQRGSPSQ